MIPVRHVPMQLYFDECVVNKYTVSVCVCCLTCGRCSVLPAALNLQVDGVGVVGKQQTGDQSKHLGGKKKENINQHQVHM